MFDLFNKKPTVPLKEIADLISTAGVGFIDVRTKDEFASGHAKGAVNIPLDIVGDKAEELKQFERVYAICQSGGRSGRAVDILSERGVNAINVPGGTIAWRSAGLPME
jgi:rhodanese-related sulfurtransferase